MDNDGRCRSLSSERPPPPLLSTWDTRTAVAVVTEVEGTSSCVAEEPKGGSTANLSDPFRVWAYAGTWPRKYALPLSGGGGCGYSTHTTGDSSRVSVDLAPAVPMHLREAQTAQSARRQAVQERCWWDPFWWLCRWTEAPGLECREHGSAWCLVGAATSRAAHVVQCGEESACCATSCECPCVGSARRSPCTHLA